MNHISWGKTTRTTTWAMAVLLAGAGVLAGCDSSANEPGSTTSASSSTPMDAAKLFATKTPAVGDNSKVLAVLDALAVKPLAPFTIELATKTEPYGITVTFTEKPTLDSATLAHELTTKGTLFLALVDNADYITWQGTEPVTVNTKSATKLLGSDIKQAADSPESFNAALNKLTTRPTS